MNRHVEQRIREWLDAEAGGPDELAERALAQALGEFGRRSPAPGFAERVLMRGFRPTVVVPAWRSSWLRAAVAVSVLSVGLAVAALPLLLLVADPVARAVGLPFISFAVHGIGHWLTAAFASWSVVDDVVTALRAWVATPAAVALLSANLALAAASLFGLKRLLRAPEESMPW